MEIEEMIKDTKTTYIYQLSLSDGSTVAQETEGLFHTLPDTVDRKLINSAVLIKVGSKDIDYVENMMVVPQRSRHKKRKNFKS